MKLWLDDLGPAPWGYESARSVNEAKTLIREAERNGIEVEVLDLDHDLGDFANHCFRFAPRPKRTLCPLPEYSG